MYDSVISVIIAQMVKNSPAVWESWLQSLGQEDPLEKGMASCLLDLFQCSSHFIYSFCSEELEIVDLEKVSKP